MIRIFPAAVAAFMLAAAGPALAQSQKERECHLQGQVFAAVQQARLNGVRKAALSERVAELLPGLPPKVLGTIPTIGNHVYGLKKRDLKKVNLGEMTKAQCLANWDQIQAMKKNLGN